MPVDEMAQNVDLIARDVGAHLDPGNQREIVVASRRRECLWQAIDDVMIGQRHDPHAVAVRQVDQLSWRQASVREGAVGMEIRRCCPSSDLAVKALDGDGAARLAIDLNEHGVEDCGAFGHRFEAIR